MIFNESNIKVIRENGYLSKYLSNKAPYFPFTKEDIKNNIIVLIDNSYDTSRCFYYINFFNDEIAYFIAFSGNGAKIISFNFTSMVIGEETFNWGKGV